MNPSLEKLNKIDTKLANLREEFKSKWNTLNQKELQRFFSQFHPKDQIKLRQDIFRSDTLLLEYLMSPQTDANWKMARSVNLGIDQLIFDAHVFYLAVAKESNLKFWTLFNGALQRIADASVSTQSVTLSSLFLEELDIYLRAREMACFPGNMTKKIQTIADQVQKLDQKDLDLSAHQKWKDEESRLLQKWKHFALEQKNKQDFPDESTPKRKCQTSTEIEGKKSQNELLSRVLKSTKTSLDFQDFMTSEVSINLIRKWVLQTLKERIHSDTLLKNIIDGYMQQDTLTFYTEWIELSRRFKVSRFKEIQSAFLQTKQKSEDLIWGFRELVFEWNRRRSERELEAKDNWLKANQSKEAIHLLRKSVQSLNQQWRNLLISKFRIVYGWLVQFSLMLTTTQSKLRLISSQQNRLLAKVLRSTLSSISNHSDSGLKVLLASVLRKVQRDLKVLGADQVRETQKLVQQFKTQTVLSDFKTDFQVQINQNVHFLESNFLSLNSLKEVLSKKVETPEPQLECFLKSSKQIMDKFKRYFFVFINNEVQAKTILRFIRSLDAPALESEQKYLFAKLLSIYENWVEKTREKKKKVFVKRRQVLWSSTSILKGLFEYWDDLVNHSLSEFKKHSSSDSDSQTSEKVVNLSKIIEGALKIDQSLKNHYFGAYFEKISKFQNEAYVTFLEVSTEMNKHFVSILESIKQDLEGKVSSKSDVKEVIDSAIKKALVKLELWFAKENLLSEKLDEWQGDLTKEAQSILKKQDVILTEHRNLWSVFKNTVFDSNSLDLFSEECELFKSSKLLK